LQNEPNVEIERKYIIAKPDSEQMAGMSDYTESDILQIYLTSPENLTRRIRRRSYLGGRVEYTETAKIRIDKMSSREFERELSEEEFCKLSDLRAPGRAPIRKIRHSFTYLGQLFEIDEYPEWKATCIMETELASREDKVEFPDFIRVIAEVTGDKRYSNAAMSGHFPEETKV